MFAKLGTKLAVFLLKHANLSVNNRNALTAEILDKLSALPLRDIITFNEEGTLQVNGRLLDIEDARLLRESAKGALSNKALQIILESVTYQSFAIAATKADKDADLLFGKAAIWWGQQILKHLITLSGDRELTP